jgi:RimJ/RimL family protein N-acetyltransferase
MQSERLLLRPFQLGDEGLILDLDGDPDVRRFLDQPEAPSHEQCVEIVARFIKAQEANPQLGYWAAFRREAPSQFVGWFHLRPARTPPHDLELGYRLKREFWNQGLATEGSSMLLRHAFDTLNAPRVIALTLADNLASRKVMEKIGMHWEADYLHDGRLPAVRYAIGRT